MKLRLAILLSTTGYAGRVPVAPGTAGSAVGLAVWAIARAAGPPGIELALAAFCAVAGTWAASVAERHFGSRDPGPVVIDEVLGMLVTLACLPLSWSVALTGFLLFRLFDIIKPFPARRLERLPGGLGIMADDVMAAIYAHLALRGLLAAAPEWIG